MLQTLSRALTSPFRAMREAGERIAERKAAGMCVHCGIVQPPPGCEACGACHNEGIAP